MTSTAGCRDACTEARQSSRCSLPSVPVTTTEPSGALRGRCAASRRTAAPTPRLTACPVSPRARLTAGPGHRDVLVPRLGDVDGAPAEGGVETLRTGR